MLKIAGKKDQGLVAVAHVPAHDPMSTKERTFRRMMMRAHRNWFSNEDFARGYVQRARCGEISPYDTWQRIKIHNAITKDDYDCAPQRDDTYIQQDVHQQELLL